MPERKFDPDWPHGHETRDGRPAEIIYTGLKSDAGSFIAVVENKDGTNKCRTYYSDGRYFDGGNDSNIDLLNREPVMEGWVNWYESGIGGCHDTREKADKWGGKGRIACTHVKAKHGEGLEDEATTLTGKNMPLTINPPKEDG